MNCKMVRDYLDQHKSSGMHSVTDYGEVANHARECAECARLLQEHQLVSTNLELIRGSVPAVPESVDSAVMSNYHRFMSDQRAAMSLALSREEGRDVASYVSTGLRQWRHSLRVALPWAAALTFAAIVAYGAIAYFVPHRATEWTSEQNVPAVSPTVAIAAKRNVPPAEVKPAVRRSSRHPLRKQSDNVEKVAYNDGSFPRTFQGLLYCDAIICPGAMNVIRVQLPAPVLGLTQASAQADGTVAADVLVGADGIARGIRVVE